MSITEILRSAEGYIPNPHLDGETPFEEFWTVRSKVLAGTGPYGKTDPDDGSDSPDFWLVEDQLNHERYQLMEFNSAEAVSVELFESLSSALKATEGWGIIINGFDYGHILLFEDRLVLAGSLFDGCTTIENVASAVKRGIESLQERKFGALRKQLKLIQLRIARVTTIATMNRFAHIATFDRYQLHDVNAVWMLQTENPGKLYMETDHGVIAEYAVDSDLTIHDPYCRDYWPYTDLHPTFWLVVYLNSQRQLTEFRYVDKTTSLQVGFARTAPALDARELEAALADPRIV